MFDSFRKPVVRRVAFVSSVLVGSWLICFAKSQREDSFDDQRLNAITNLIEFSV